MPFSVGKSPLLFRALLGTSALVAASVVSLSVLFLLQQQVAFQRQFELRAESLASSLAGQSQFALLLANRPELESMARSALAGSGDVLYVVVEDAAGHHMASAQRAPADRRAVPGGGDATGPAQIRNVQLGPNGPRCVEASVPVIHKGEDGLFSRQSSPGEALGRIRVAMSLESSRALFISTLRNVVVIAFLILLLAFALDYAHIRRLLRPLVELSEAAKLVGEGRGGNLRAVQRSDDEIGALVVSFNQMVEQVEQRTRELSEQVAAKEHARSELAAAQQRLVELSRRSGMAEVATSVLHNVGNVLNSVNVSATVVAGKIKESRVDKLLVVVDMLTSHSGDLAEFLDRDPKGRRVLPYLSNLGLYLQRQRDLMLNELEHLTAYIGHIKQIVATQQNYAKVSGLVESFLLADLVDDALRILEPGFRRHEIGLLRDFEDVPLMTSDRHQILQIILNLLRNAQQAIDNGKRPERLIRVRIRRHGADRIQVDVKDSGVGLPPENLTRIFAHGFTTKADGHGFGLHSGALAARQLGGTLRAESEGIGLGATFTLELPISVAVAATTQNEEVSYETTNVY